MPHLKKGGGAFVVNLIVFCAFILFSLPLANNCAAICGCVYCCIRVLITHLGLRPACI